MILEKGKVNFGQSVKDFWKGYVDFKGRTTRSGYWWAILFLYLIFFILGMLGICTLSNSYALRILGGTSLSVLTIFLIATIIPSLMLLFRRWRDAGLTGKAILLFIVLILCAGSISAFYPKFGGAVSSILSICSLVVTLLPTNQLVITSNNAILKFLFRQF